MTSQIRGRFIIGWLVATVLLAGLAGLGFWGANFVHDSVHNQLAPQQIVFGPAATITAAEYPAADRAQVLQYAGQQVVNGEQAKVYADNYIAVHMQGIAGGKTYSQVSAAYLKTPTNQKLAATRMTLFMGTMLRASLLQAYAWWTIGTYIFWAALGLTAGAVIALLALLYEALFAAQTGKVPTVTTRPVAGGVGV